ncbi:MAG: Dabb family protein [Thermoplasmatota archaeon]
MTIRIVQAKFAEEHKDRVMNALEEAEKAFPKIPGVVGFQCGAASEDNDEYDLAFLVEFDAFEDVEGYLASKVHEDFANKHLRPFATVVARNYEI